MKTFTNENVQNSKQFNSAINEVFGAIGSRNEQVQQLLVLSVLEAAKLADNGTVTNNLNWLTSLLVKAEQTKGINLLKLVRYVKEVLCLNTVTWNAEKSRLTKVKDKAVVLQYDTAPTVTWFDYGKKETVKKAFDYGKRVTSAINNALDDDKGGMTKLEVVKAMLASGISGADMFDLLEQLANDDEQQAA